MRGRPLLTSVYVRSRGEGETAVLDAFPSAKLVRPAIFRRTPVFPIHFLRFRSGRLGRFRPTTYPIAGCSASGSTKLTVPPRAYGARESVKAI